MQFVIPTLSGNMLYHPGLPRPWLKEAFRLLRSDPTRRNGATVNIVANTLYPSVRRKR